jgi:hypothetical protein
MALMSLFHGMKSAEVPVIVLSFMDMSEIQRRRPNDDLIDCHLGRLLNSVSGRARDRIGRKSHRGLVELAQIFPVASSELLSGSSVETAPGEIMVQRIFSECSSTRNPSINVRTAGFVAQ